MDSQSGRAVIRCPWLRFARGHRMGVALRITRTEHSAAELRALAGKCHDGAQVRRLLALALVLEGCPRTQAAEQNGMDRQTLRDWVHRYNNHGVDGLQSRHGPGPAPALNEQQMAELKALVITLRANEDETSSPREFRLEGAEGSSQS